jgi:hypothetical protein
MAVSDRALAITVANVHDMTAVGCYGSDLAENVHPAREISVSGAPGGATLFHTVAWCTLRRSSVAAVGGPHRAGQWARR